MKLLGVALIHEYLQCNVQKGSNVQNQNIRLNWAKFHHHHIFLKSRNYIKRTQKFRNSLEISELLKHTK